MATLVEGDPKVPFSITTKPRCRGGHYSIPRIAPLYPWSSSYKCCVFSQVASSTIFWVFAMTQSGFEPWSLGPLTSTLLIRPMALWFEIDRFLPHLCEKSQEVYKIFLSSLMWLFYYPDEFSLSHLSAEQVLSGTIILTKSYDNGLVWFYTTSTFLGYLMPNPFLYI